MGCRDWLSDDNMTISGCQSVALRDYQAQMIADLRTACRRHDRVLASAPTGAGKTVIFSRIAAAAAERGSKVLVLVHRRELLQQAQRRVTVPVQTIQSWVPDGEDLIILDEAHHACAKSWGDKLGFCKRIIGFTATPQRLDNLGLDGIFEEMVLGPSTRELIVAGWLSRYKLYAPPGGENRRGVANVVKNWRLLAPGRQTIGFCSSVAHMRQVASAFEAAGIPAGCIDGRMPQAVRDAVIERFRKAEIMVLLSVELISEGFDVPTCDCVLLMRSTESLAMYLQQVGRGLRPSNRECIILDCVGNSNRHGLPDEERIWSLSGHAKPRNGLVADVPVRVCSQCFSVHQPSFRTCPACGFHHPLDARIPEEYELILQEKHAARREISRARSESELRIIAKERGYHPGWVTRMLAARNSRRY